ncbi:SUMF1/EgtB/PvdO family nonheme iron enzyme [Streptomyces atriruber]|uniref:SUMF1/EgtB/PvdO family nonheme iron enzyme n=1 Tax=Streptomyces atriruber TaxID=545121 RepID=UPI0012FEE871|nr:SUMF1/EgtB/PvdO family nonheme iron enzyme [Streptomyces atriruber]
MADLLSQLRKTAGTPSLREIAARTNNLMQRHQAQGASRLTGPHVQPTRVPLVTLSRLFKGELITQWAQVYTTLWALGDSQQRPPQAQVEALRRLWNARYDAERGGEAVADDREAVVYRRDIHLACGSLLRGPLLPLTIWQPSHGTADAREALRTWLASTQRLSTVVGGVGYGKSMLAMWLADELAQEPNGPVPVRVSARRVLGNTGQDTSAVSDTDMSLLRFAHPPLPKRLRESIGGGDTDAVVILDDLDEVGALTATGFDSSRRVLHQAFTSLGSNIRIVVCCRAVALNYSDPSHATEQRALMEETEFAVRQVIDPDVTGSTLLGIDAVEQDEAEAFLRQRGVSDEWFASVGWPLPIELTPQLIQLLVTLGRTSRGKAHELSLDQIYEQVAFAWKRSVPILERAERRDWSALLTYLEQRSASFMRPMRVSPELDRLAELAGFLSSDQLGSLRFTHFSWQEFFLARYLAAEILSNRAALLSRLNLLFDSNINRFLVPQLLRGRRYRAITTSQQLRVVTVGDFKEFLADTKWRGGIGWGVHPAGERIRDRWRPPGDMTGSLSAEGGPPLGAADNDPVTHVSWYDAERFAAWMGGRLPLGDSPAPRSHKQTAPRYAWTERWAEESMAEMELQPLQQNLTAQKTSRNPDFRSPQIGIAVMTTMPYWSGFNLSGSTTSHLEGG